MSSPRKLACIEPFRVEILRFHMDFFEIHPKTQRIRTEKFENKVKISGFRSPAMPVPRGLDRST